MGHAIESQRNISSAPVTYPLGDMHNGAQYAQSPHISILHQILHQIPYLYPAYKVSLWTGRLKAKGRALGMRAEQPIFVFGNQANVTLEFRVGGFHCIMFSGHFCIITTVSLVRP